MIYLEYTMSSAYYLKYEMLWATVWMHESYFFLCEQLNIMGLQKLSRAKPELFSCALQGLGTVVL